MWLLDGFFLFHLQDVIRQAEEHLKAVSAQPGYAIAVLQVIIAYSLCPWCSRDALANAATLLLLQVIAAGDAVGADVRLAAAVNFKNTVKYRWVSQLVAVWTAAALSTGMPSSVLSTS
jgi:hypothetical protein